MDGFFRGSDSPVSTAYIHADTAIAYSKKDADNRKKTTVRSRWMEEDREEKTEGGRPRKGRSGGAVMLEGYIDVAEGGKKGSDGGGDAVGRTKSLTDEDLEELKGCLDLGFGFAYDEIPELCNTLPALELCYSMSQKFLDEQQQQHQRHSLEGVGDVGDAFGASSVGHSTPIANWKISNPGDHPDDVKARLKYWAQAVACTVRLCN